MIFVDEATLYLKAGTGGSGTVSFHKEKHVPRGGPNGADGGKGGSIIFLADPHKRTLYDVNLKKKFIAENGGHARGNKKGADGKDVIIGVPVGTLIIDNELNSTIIDLCTEGMSYIICKGGRGGHGNLHYVSSVRQAPLISEKGEPGEELTVRLELKLLADVGLVGLPNAGKSTLLSRISSAKPKIADYPFTTITPNLGVVLVNDRTFTVADMPGLIEGASEGTGLGHYFLKHIERTKILVHVLDALPIDETDPICNYKLIRNELEKYGDKVAQKCHIIALNKSDLLPAEKLNELKERLNELHPSLFIISAVTGHGIDPLLFKISHLLESIPKEQEVGLALPLSRFKIEDTWDVLKTDRGFELTGKKILRMLSMTKLDNHDSLQYLHRRLERIGVMDKLRSLGAQNGDTVFFGEAEFSYSE